MDDGLDTPHISHEFLRSTWKIIEIHRNAMDSG